MPLIPGDVRSAVAAVAALTECNPFVPERIQLVERILGPAFVPIGSVWYAAADVGESDPNLARLRERVEQLVGDLQKRLAAGAVATTEEIADYRGAVFYLLWLRYEDDWLALIEAGDGERPSSKKVSSYERFAHDAVQFLSPLPDETVDPAHLFAIGFQSRRAFDHIFRKIFGATLPAARLRATVWQSIFTHRSASYRAGLFDRMADIATLITGESGLLTDLLHKLSRCSVWSAVASLARLRVGRALIAFPALRSARRRSYSDCRFSQNCALVPKKWARRSAVSPVIARCPFRMAVIRLVGTLSWRDSSAALIPSSFSSSARCSPGCIGARAMAISF